MFNSLQTAFQQARQALTPVATESSFLSTGMLTPDEFVTAGDSLCAQLRIWRWARSAPGNEKSYLPPDKQFLTLSGAVATQRARDMETGAAAAEMTEDGEWVASGGAASVEDEYTDINEMGHGTTAAAYADIDDYLDPAVAAMAAADTGVVKPMGERRMYTLAIVYDKYYRTPRVYLQGSSPSGQVLMPDKMMEDIVQDYAGKTATMERHPHLPDAGIYVSIHPCRHAATMKRLLQACTDGGAAPTITSYMTYFLKFITSMIPTIEYDYTASASVGGC
jgi:ubiquitin-like-conjugating enzyme ATG3